MTDRLEAKLIEVAEGLEWCRKELSFRLNVNGRARPCVCAHDRTSHVEDGPCRFVFCTCQTFNGEPRKETVQEAGRRIKNERVAEYDAFPRYCGKMMASHPTYSCTLEQGHQGPNHQYWTAEGLLAAGWVATEPPA